MDTLQGPPQDSAQPKVPRQDSAQREVARQDSAQREVARQDSGTSGPSGPSGPQRPVPRPRALPPLSPVLKDGLAHLASALVNMGMALKPKVLSRVRGGQATYADFLHVFQTAQMCAEKADHVCAAYNLHPAENRVPERLQARRFDCLVPQTPEFPLRAELEYQRVKNPSKVRCRAARCRPPAALPTVTHPHASDTATHPHTSDTATHPHPRQAASGTWPLPKTELKAFREWAEAEEFPADEEGGEGGKGCSPLEAEIEARVAAETAEAVNRVMSRLAALEAAFKDAGATVMTADDAVKSVAATVAGHEARLQKLTCVANNLIKYVREASPSPKKRKAGGGL